MHGSPALPGLRSIYPFLLSKPASPRSRSLARLWSHTTTSCGSGANGGISTGADRPEDLLLSRRRRGDRRSGDTGGAVGHVARRRHVVVAAAPRAGVRLRQCGRRRRRAGRSTLRRRKLLPVPPLPPVHPKPSPCKQQQATSGGGVKPTSYQRRPGSWTSPFTRSCSVNSATTAAPRSGSGSFSCPSFPLMRSRSAGSAAAAQGGGLGGVVSGGGHHRPPQHKKAGATAAAYYYGGSRNGSSGHGVRVSPVINVPSIGTSMVNMLSYLLCDCGNKTTKNRGFGLNC